jgi:hypothetical protein
MIWRDQTMDGQFLDHGGAGGQYNMVPVEGGFRYGTSMINERGEMLSLTDMWKAAGADPSRQPAEWLRSAEATRFCEYLAESLNLGISQVWISKPGRHGGGTWAHWQVAMAYAKYLSPEFHMACNVIVRAHMEGRTEVFAQDGINPLGVHRTVVRPATLREVAVSLDACLRIAKRFGIVGNQALLMASRATEKHIGVNPMVMMGIPSLEAPEAEQHLNVSDIGRRLDGRSGKAVNQLLKERGFQTDHRNAKGDLIWEPTKAGGRFAVMVDTGKKQGDGAPVRQLRWRSGILTVLKGEAH